MEKGQSLSATTREVDHKPQENRKLLPDQRTFSPEPPTELTTSPYDHIENPAKLTRRNEKLLYSYL